MKNSILTKFRPRLFLLWGNDIDDDTIFTYVDIFYVYRGHLFDCLVLLHDFALGRCGRLSQPSTSLSMHWITSSTHYWTCDFTMHCTGWGKKTRLFFRVDNFLMASGRKACSMSSFLILSRNKLQKLHVSECNMLCLICRNNETHELLLLLLLQNLWSAQIQVRCADVARWGTRLAGKGKEVSFETTFERTNGW